jgi:hypothetical protein
MTLELSIGSSHSSYGAASRAESDGSLMWGAPATCNAGGSARDLGGSDTSTDSIDGMAFLTTFEPAEAWTPQLARRFNALAGRYADGTLTEEESRELEYLKDARRTFVAPPDADEVIRSIARRKMTEEILSTLDRYVRWHDSENCPPGKA